MTSFRELAGRFERRAPESMAFPLPAWEVKDRKLFDRYIISRKGEYNPQTDLPWDKLDVEGYSEEEKIALRYYWSRHAIFEYSLLMPISTGIQHSMLQGYPSEIKQLLMMHLRDEWNHTEMAAEAARRLGGVLLVPSLPLRYREQYEQRMASLGRDIHPTFTRISFSEMAVGRGWYARFRELKDPLAKAIFTLIYKDENRHSRGNWEWATRGVQNTDMKVPDEVKKETERLLANIANVDGPAYGWLGFGYLALPKEEQEFHKQCVEIARELGVTHLDADGFLSEYTRGARELEKLIGDAGYTARVD